MINQKWNTVLHLTGTLQYIITRMQHSQNLLETIDKIFTHKLRVELKYLSAFAGWLQGRLCILQIKLKIQATLVQNDLMTF